jgi:hypothetical protein
VKALVTAIALVLLAQGDAAVESQDLGEPGTSAPAQEAAPDPASERNEDADDLRPVEPEPTPADTGRQKDEKATAETESTAPVAAFWFVETEN